MTFVLSVGLFVSGLIADGITTSHRLLEEVLYHTRRVEYDHRSGASALADVELRTLEVAAPAGSG
jgi:hypothetical protein